MAAFSDKTVVEGAVNKILSTIDEDTRDYIASMITDGDDIEDTKESVNAMIEGADEENAEELQRKLWEAIESSGGRSQQQEKDDDSCDTGGVTKLLDKKITIGDSDIKTFASGIIAKEEDGDDQSRGIGYASFFANQIGIRTEAAISEKVSVCSLCSSATE